MDFPAVITYVSGPAGALVALAWWIFTLRRDVAELRKIIEAERRRADAAEEAARTANALIAGVLERSRR